MLHIECIYVMFVVGNEYCVAYAALNFNLDEELWTLEKFYY